MNNSKLFLPVLIFLMLLSVSSTTFSSSDDRCDGCDRTAVLKEITGLERDSITSHLVEHSTSPCFHLQNLATVKKFGGGSKWKPPEFQGGFTGFKQDLRDAL